MDMMQDRVFDFDGVRFFRLTSPSIKLPLAQLYPRSINQEIFPDTQTEIPVSAWLVEYGDKLVLIDAGINRQGEDQLPVSHGAGPTLFAQMELFGKKPEDVSMVILTHLHLDHVGWNTLFEDGAWKPAFPEATYYMARAEINYLLSEKGNAEGGDRIFTNSILPLFLDNQVTVISAPRAEITKGIEYQSYPGHSPGHSVVWFRTPNAELCFCGDIFHSVRQITQPSLSSSFCRNTVQALSSRKTFLKHAAARGALVCTAHLSFPSAGFIVRSGAGWAWKPLQST